MAFITYMIECLNHKICRVNHKIFVQSNLRSQILRTDRAKIVCVISVAFVAIYEMNEQLSNSMILTVYLLQSNCIFILYVLVNQ